MNDHNHAAAHNMERTGGSFAAAIAAAYFAADSHNRARVLDAFADLFECFAPVRPVTSTDYSGRTCTLTHNGQPVKLGEILESSRGDHYRVTGGRAPQKPSSTGHIWTDGGEFYPSVFNCTWTPNTTEGA